MENKRKLLQDKIKSINTFLIAGDGTANLHEQRVKMLKELADLDHLVRVDLAEKEKV